ncbi:hypothetical protein [Micavibrio aeruginosavorus]|uniref:hypothetical protein n=1 Tax=Micavibrio aeruginosavorus TaxID=349221 RepID=UPI003F4A9A72
MKSFEEMVLPPGKTIEELLAENLRDIAEIGKANARFQFVWVCGQKMVDANPGVREAWRARAEAAKAAQSSPSMKP